MTRTEHSPGTGSRACKVDKTKTAVLPMPDFAWHRMSVLRSACGIQDCWTICRKWLDSVRQRVTRCVRPSPSSHWLILSPDLAISCSFMYFCVEYYLNHNTSIAFWWLVFPFLRQTSSLQSFRSIRVDLDEQHLKCRCELKSNSVLSRIFRLMLLNDLGFCWRWTNWIDKRWRDAKWV